MKSMLFVAALAAAAPSVAQEPVMASAQQMIVARKADIGSSLPSNSEVWLSLNSGLSSKSLKVGDKFDLTVSRDVMMGDYVVISRGTPAHGQISYRTGKGAFGKSAKMEFDLVDVQVGQRFIPVSGHYRIEGQGNTGAAVGAVVAVGVFGAFVTGHSAAAAQGSEWKAYTKEPLMVALAPSAPAPTPAATVATAPAASPVAAQATVTPIALTRSPN
ncbi:hypothetical protein [Sphingomonas sp. MMS24-J13]|uniref:hypothetical protein n=1 Tax=Sphingomonas sp. MMS24-J13 TaxID=3238686 RepID=UPI0038512AFA